MLNVKELRSKIMECARKRMFPCEQSDINQQIVRDHEIGFEAVLTGRGDEKILLPEDGNVVFLFRGQSQEYVPCFPTLYRQTPRPLTESEIFVWRMRLILFRDLLDSHPIVAHFFKKHNFRIDYEGLAQHYGLSTSVLDLTSNLDIALFFAMTWYDSMSECYHEFDDGKDRVGILYVFCPVRDNEPTPAYIGEYLQSNITPIGLQPFLRPARQKGYAIHIQPGKSTKSWAYRFKFSCDDSKAIFEKFHSGKDLWIDDPLADKAREIKEINNFSFEIFDRTYKEFRPKGYSKTKLKKELAKQGITLMKRVRSPKFSQEECMTFISEWNDHAGKEFCDTIGRRSWFEIEDHSGVTSDVLQPRIKNKYDFRTLKLIGIREFVKLMGCPEDPDGAEWINYMNTPNETHCKFPKDDQGWIEVPAHMENLFSERFLTPEDYLIKGTLQ